MKTADKIEKCVQELNGGDQRYQGRKTPERKIDIIKASFRYGIAPDLIFKILGE